jgi:transposase
MSKRGNARLRYAFWMAAGSAIRQRRNTFRLKYDRYVASDPSNADLKRKAFSAVAAKMARVVHALINSDTDYQYLYVK